MVSKKQVLNANIRLHTQLADEYRDSEPHYRPENVERVREIIRTLAGPARGRSLLDIGCGMGFIIDIAKNYFNSISGIDITPAMLEKVDAESDSCDIHLKIAEVENLPFEDNMFDVVTAYAVLHHLHDLRPAFEEIYRVLKKGGIFYSDTDPNYYFWEAFNNLPESGVYSEIVKREIYAVKHKDSELEERFNVPREVLNTAELLKHVKGGLKKEELERMLADIGFSSVDIKYEWFLGEAGVIHSDRTKNAAGILRGHMREMLPLSRHLFKYIGIYATK